MQCLWPLMMLTRNLSNTRCSKTMMAPTGRTIIVCEKLLDLGGPYIRTPLYRTFYLNCLKMVLITAFLHHIIINVLGQFPWQPLNVISCTNKENYLDFLIGEQLTIQELAKMRCSAFIYAFYHTLLLYHHGYMYIKCLI